jgi:hypothetical protein
MKKLDDGEYYERERERERDQEPCQVRAKSQIPPEQSTNLFIMFHVLKYITLLSKRQEPNMGKHG